MTPDDLPSPAMFHVEHDDRYYLDDEERTLATLASNVAAGAGEWMPAYELAKYSVSVARGIVCEVTDGREGGESSRSNWRTAWAMLARELPPGVAQRVQRYAERLTDRHTWEVVGPAPGGMKTQKCVHCGATTEQSIPSVHGCIPRTGPEPGDVE